MKNAGLYRGRSLDEALSVACTELRARLGEVLYEVESEDGRNDVSVRAEIDPVAVIGLFLSESLGAGGLQIKARLESGAEALEGELSGEDLRVLTNGGGRGLDALQYLCNRVLNRRMPEHPPVHLDADGFKHRRAGKLAETARAAANEAVRHHRSVMLDPLTPAARRDVHVALVDDGRVETESHGNGFLKRVVVRPRRRR